MRGPRERGRTDYIAGPAVALRPYGSRNPKYIRAYCKAAPAILWPAAYIVRRDADAADNFREWWRKYAYVHGDGLITALQRYRAICRYAHKHVPREARLTRRAIAKSIREVRRVERDVARFVEQHGMDLPALESWLRPRVKRLSAVASSARLAEAIAHGTVRFDPPSPLARIVAMAELAR